MKAVRLTIVGLILIIAATAARIALADQYEISGNASGSNNSLNINQNQSTDPPILTSTPMPTPAEIPEVQPREMPRWMLA